MKRLLLDTNVILWMMGNHRRLGQVARHQIADADDVFFSPVSVWEMAIKNGRIFTVDVTAMLSFMHQAGLKELPVTALHAKAVEALPKHHADPFDRMLIAQAMAEGLGLLTGDNVIPGYGVFVYKI
jgi:PIN domain nuclease of toxin-antitoxin system